MAKKKERTKKHPLLTLLGLLLLEGALVFLLIPSQALVTARQQEEQMIQRQLGDETAHQVKQHADKWYQACFVDTGFLEATYTFLVDREEAPNDLQFDDRGLAALVKKRLNAFWLAFYLAFWRMSALSIWVPFLIPILCAAGIDGLIQREIRKWRFSFSSPMAHRSSTKILWVALTVAILIPFIPMATPPMVPPILIGISAIAVWMASSNIQKRV